MGPTRRRIEPGEKAEKRTSGTTTRGTKARESRREKKNRPRMGFEVEMLRKKSSRHTSSQCSAGREETITEAG
jgi:hypothetical protein